MEELVSRSPKIEAELAELEIAERPPHKVLARFGHADRPAIGVTKDHEQRNAEIGDGIFQARKRHCCDDIARIYDHEQIARILIEDELRGPRDDAEGKAFAPRKAPAPARAQRRVSADDELVCVV